MDEIPRYVEHPGTVRISGSTNPRSAGRFAFHNFKNGVTPIEFLCIGASANQQATKAMGVFLFMVEKLSPGATLAFQPLRYQVETTVAGGPNAIKDAIVWRTLMLLKNTDGIHENNSSNISRVAAQSHSPEVPEAVLH